MNVKINILKPETNKKLKIIYNLSTVVVKEHVYVRVLLTRLLQRVVTNILVLKLLNLDHY